jgi:hypothetical protein
LLAIVLVVNAGIGTERVFVRRKKGHVHKADRIFDPPALLSWLFMLFASK